MPQVNPNIIRGDAQVVTQPSFSDQLLQLVQALSQQQYQQRMAKTQEDYQKLQEQEFATKEAHWGQEQDQTFEDFFKTTWLPAFQKAHPQPSQPQATQGQPPWGTPIPAPPQQNPMLSALVQAFSQYGGMNNGS
jgi:hypothetical protein